MSGIRVLAFCIAIPLAAFFGFVGFNKAFASLADLARFHAWTVWLPEWLGRLVGWSEMLGAALLPVSLVVATWRRLVCPIASYFVANQAVAAGIHLAHGERAALPQNFILATLFVLVAALATRAPKPVIAT